MTTKDQAITWLPTGPWSKEAEMVEAWLANKPAPDCRTCLHMAHCKFQKIGVAYMNCTNGDQYQPAPAVVLWRTEP